MQEGGATHVRRTPRRGFRSSSPRARPRGARPRAGVGAKAKAAPAPGDRVYCEAESAFLYRAQRLCTAERAQEVESEIAELSSRSAAAGGSDFESQILCGEVDVVQDCSPVGLGLGEQERLAFLREQMLIYGQVVRAMEAQEEKLAQTSRCGRLYDELTSLLQTLEASFDRVQRIPATTFKRLCDSMESTWAKLREGCVMVDHPVKCVASGSAGGALGCVGGALASSLTVASGAVIGGVVGMLAAAVLLDLAYMEKYELDTGVMDFESARNSFMLQLDNLLQRLQSEEDPSPAALQALRRTLDRCFMRPLFMPAEGDLCVVCQDPFPAVGDEDPGSGAVRAPLCEGDHFLHRKCHVRWVQSSCDVRCMVCRQ